MVSLHSTATLRSSIEIEETETEVIVIAQIPQIAAENLEIRIAPQTLLLWGEQMERVRIDGYCDFSYPAVQFHKLINLPHPVQPETVMVASQANVLILTLLKSATIPYREFYINGLGNPLPLHQPGSIKTKSMHTA